MDAQGKRIGVVLLGTVALVVLITFLAWLGKDRSVRGPNVDLSGAWQHFGNE